MINQISIKDIESPELDPEITKWVAWFTECSADGNGRSSHMMKLWDGDKRQQFLVELEAWLNGDVYWTGEKWESKR